jgi:hypothetical protein
MVDTALAELRRLSVRPHPGPNSNAPAPAPLSQGDALQAVHQLGGREAPPLRVDSFETRTGQRGTPVEESLQPFDVGGRLVHSQHFRRHQHAPRGESSMPEPTRRYARGPGSHKSETSAVG